MCAAVVTLLRSLGLAVVVAVASHQLPGAMLHALKVLKSHERVHEVCLAARREHGAPLVETGRRQN